jgi:hypothetical protein
MIPFSEMDNEIMALPRAEVVPVYHENGEKSKFSVVKDVEGTHEYAAVSDRYSLIQHTDALYKVLDAVQGAGIDGNGRTKYFGGKCYMDMTFSNMKVEDPTGTDINLGYSVRNTYDATGGVTLFPFALRGICSNGMLFNSTPDLKLNIVSIRHMGDIVQKVTRGIKNLMEQTLRIEGVFVEMIDRASQNIIEFKGNELELTMAEYTGSKLSARRIIESSKMSLNQEITQWDIYNALTQYASWNATNAPEYERLQRGAERVISLTPENLINVRNQVVAREIAALA